MLMNCRSKVGLFVLATFFVAMFIAPTAEATPVTYDFTVNVTSGPFSWTSDRGSFSFDSSSIVPGSINPNTGLLTALDFTFDGVRYNAGMANTGWLGFTPAGDLRSFAFGTNCDAGGCGITGFGNNVRWFAYDPNPFTGAGGFSYSIDNEYYGGTLTFARAAVPEPAVLGMFGLGVVLIGLFMAMRRCSGQVIPDCNESSNLVA